MSYIAADLESTDKKKRHTVEEKLRDLHLSEQPEVKKRKEMNGDYCDEFISGACSRNGPEFIESVRPEERCPSCNEVALKPHTTDCGHSYCGKSIDALKRTNITQVRCIGRDEDEVDGQCQQMIVVENLKPDKALEKVINNKVIKCSNHTSGCKKTLKYRRLNQHLTQECDYSNTRCPTCNREVMRMELAEHQSGCRSKACSLASIGCEHVSEPDDVASTSSSGLDHSPGVHLALMYQFLASVRATAEFSLTTLDAAMTRQASAVTSQEQALHMLAHPDEQKNEATNIQELHSHFANKRLDARNALEKYNRLIHVDYPTRVAEPVLRQKYRSQWQEQQEEERNEFMSKFIQETIEAPMLLNQGSMIFKLGNFSEKRMKAIKGELKRGVYGPLFYTHEFGYLMVPIVYPNGDGGGTGTHLSIFIAIKKGKFDPLLKWPVVGRITISILSQRRVGRETVRHSFKTDVASLSYHRPTQEINQASGIPRALDLNLLKQPSDFLVDDTLFIQMQVEPQL